MRSRLRVVIIGINYAPEHTGIGPYTTAAAEHLASLGHIVTVLTGVPHYPGWAIPPGYRWCSGRAEQARHVEVRRFRHYVPRRQDALRRGLYEFTFAGHLLARGRVRGPDVVIGVVPSLFSGLVAARLARRTEARLLIWLQDSMGAAAEQSGVAGGRVVAEAVARLERKLVQKADRVIIVSDAFLPAIERAGAGSEKAVTVLNWVRLQPPSKAREVTRRELDWGDRETIVLHTGNMGLKQDLGRVVEAARLASAASAPLKFVLMGDGNQRAEVENAARGLPKLQLLDPVPEAGYSNVLAAADLLLVNERQGVLDMSLPSKLTSYLASGRPVVASVDPRGGTAAHVRRSLGGVVARDQTPEALLAEAWELARDPDHARTLGLQGKEFARTYLTAEASLAQISHLVEEGHSGRFVEADHGRSTADDS